LYGNNLKKKKKKKIDFFFFSFFESSKNKEKNRCHVFAIHDQEDLTSGRLDLSKSDS
jgi:hypothetical protein